ncbi:MAG: hypothetical protein R3C14_29845 [Caldilineaceae bacterium]
MVAIYTYLYSGFHFNRSIEAQQNFASLPDLAIAQDEVHILRYDGQIFVLRQNRSKKRLLMW